MTPDTDCYRVGAVPKHTLHAAPAPLSHLYNRLLLLNAFGARKRMVTP